MEYDLFVQYNSTSLHTCSFVIIIIIIITTLRILAVQTICKCRGSALHPWCDKRIASAKETCCVKSVTRLIGVISRIGLSELADATELCLNPLYVEALRSLVDSINRTATKRTRIARTKT